MARLFPLMAAAALCVSGCVSFPDAPAATSAPRLDDTAIYAVDGAALALQSWPADKPRALILAVHGMNDYANAFDLAGDWLSSQAGISVYAYDQRGFGRSGDFGRWPGGAALQSDARAALTALRAAYPDTPIFALGHSMGAAVLMAAQAHAPLDADGLILVAPGVWGGSALPTPYRAASNFTAMLAPGKTLTGARTGRRATDNIAVLRRMARDPLVIKETRLDAVVGVIRIMGEAFDRADRSCADALFLIGQKDEIIPLGVMEATAENLCRAPDIRRYRDGWHMLLRDRQRETVLRDIAGWIDHRLDVNDTE